jgi:hypothetical protein
VIRRRTRPSSARIVARSFRLKDMECREPFF